MKRKKRPRSRRRVLVTGGTVTVATLGLSNCDNGCGTSVDPLPPPPLVCSEANKGQNFDPSATLQDSLLTVDLISSGWYPGVDTAYVNNVVGATLDSLQVDAYFFGATFVLDSPTVTEVTFTLAGTLQLEGGPCDFSRNFTVTIDNGNVTVAQVRPRELPLMPGRDVRIELVERDGRRLRLRPAGAGSEPAVWSVTGGEFEDCDDGCILWELPAEAGFYQVDLYVDRGEGSFVFDALSFQVV
jgi:hypothetical protein